MQILNKLKYYNWCHDIFYFLEDCFPHHFTKPFAPFHKEIIETLTKYNFVAIAAPRQHGKTHLVTFGWIMWNLICNENRHFFILISNNYNNATKFLAPIKEEIEHNVKIREMFGDLKSEKWSEDEAEFRNHDNSFRKKIIVGGNDFKIRGVKFLQYRPDLLCVDDAEDDELVKSDIRRESFENWFIKAAEESMSIDTQNNQIVFIGTILHRDSQLSKLQIGEGRYRKWKSLFYEAIQNAYKPDEKAIWEEGKSLKELREIREADPYKFAQEYMNNPVPFEHATFKEEYFDDYEDKDLPKDLVVNITCDLACTDRTYSDYTVILPVGVDAWGDLWILPYHRARYTDPDKIIEEILNMYEKYKGKENWAFGKLGVEKTAFQRFLIKNLDKRRKERKLHFPIMELDAKGDKVSRIAQLQPLFASGDIHIKKTMLDLKQELLDFPRGMHDDIIDCLSYMLEMTKNRPVIKKPVNIKWEVTPEKQREKIIRKIRSVQLPKTYISFLSR